MTTYAIRKEQYAGSDNELFYVFTITEAGMSHHFADDLFESEADFYVAELSKLSPKTIAMLCGEYDCYGQVKQFKQTA